MSFRSFQTEQEEQRARALIASIDRGEAWIFDGAPNSPDFGGFIRRLIYSQGGHFGTLCICRFRGRLRIQLGFAPDVPKGAENETAGPILDIIRQYPGQVSLWYPPGNHRLHAWLQANIPWPLRGHSTFELTWPAGKSPESEDLPEPLAIIDFEETYLEAVARCWIQPCVIPLMTPKTGPSPEIVRHWAPNGATKPSPASVLSC